MTTKSTGDRVDVIDDVAGQCLQRVSIMGVELFRHDERRRRVFGGQPRDDLVVAGDHQDRSVLRNQSRPEIREQIGAGEAARQWSAQQFARPDDGHPIGQGDVCRFGGEPLVLVFGVPDDVVDVGRDDTAPCRARQIGVVEQAFTDGTDGGSVEKVDPEKASYRRVSVHPRHHCVNR